jgi:hypothetical protein
MSNLDFIDKLMLLVLALSCLMAATQVSLASIRARQTSPHYRRKK